MSANVRTATGIIALAIAYFVFGKLGLSLAFLNKSASAVWPPTGIALAALLLWGGRLWPGVFLGAFLVNVITQGSFLTTVGIATGNTLEAVLGWFLVQRCASGINVFERVSDIVRYILLAAGLSTAVSATVGVTSLCLGGFGAWPNYGAIWLTWWLGNLVSNLIVTPLLMLWATRGVPSLKWPHIFEGAALLAAAGVIAHIVFRQQAYSLAYLTLVPCLWAVFRFGQRAAITCVFVISCFALWATLQGRGQFATADANESLVLLQGFIGTLSVVALVTGAVTRQRTAAEQRLQVQHEKLRDSEAKLVQAHAELQGHAKELEQTVAERTAELRETVAELESFSYSIAHDMRGPLRAMTAFSEALTDDYRGKLDAQGIDFLTRIHNSAIRLDALIRDVLTYSRVAKAHIQLKPIDLSAMIRQVIEEYPDLKPPTAQITIHEPLPCVLGHEAYLTQCISNLLVNAVKFVRPGTQPRISIRGEQDGEFAKVWIEDNGIGIESAHFERIFQIFGRVHSEKKYDGTGIGLAIAKKAVERMGGQIGVESELDKGSRFWIRLKRAK